MSDYVQQGIITPEGEKLIAFLDSMCDDFERSESIGLSGHVGHYYTFGYKADGKAARMPQQNRAGFGVGAAAWLEEFDSLAKRAAEDMRYFESLQVAQTQQVETQNSIVEQLENLRKEITQLKRRNTLLENKVNAADAEAVDAPAEDEEANTEDEAAADEDTPDTEDEPEAETEEA